MRVLPLVYVASLSGLATAAPVPPTTGITKIINLLGEMKETGESEMAEKNKEAAEKKNECVAAITGFEKDIEFTTENFNEAKACEEEATGKAQQEQGKAVTLVQEIAEHNEALADAKKVYEEARSTNSKEQGELQEGVAMLSKAYSVLKRALAPKDGAASLIQLTRSGALTTGQSEEIQKTLIAMAAIVDAGHVFSSKSKDKMISFLSQVSGGLSKDDDMSFSFAQQPAASTSSYDSKSGGILDAIEEMQEETEDNLNKLTTSMLENRHAFELLSQQTTSTVESKTQQMNAANKIAAENKGKAGECKADKEEQGSSLAAANKQLKTKNFECKEYEEAHAREIEDMTAESQVLGKAIEILSGKFGGDDAAETTDKDAKAAGFLQVKKVTKHVQLSLLATAMDSASMAKKNRFAAQLQKVGQRFNSFALIQAAAQVSTGKAGVFDKILKMINDMIVKLEDAQAKEAAAHADCQAKKAEGKKMTEKAVNKFDKLSARRDKNSAEAAKVAQKLIETQASLKSQNDAIAESTNLRNEDGASNAAIIKECTESIDAITSALGVLREYFNADSSGRGASEKASAILDILDTAQMDFEKCKVDTETAESAAKSAFEKEKQAHAVSSASLGATIQSKTAHQKNLQKQVSTNDADLEEAQKELTAAEGFVKAVNAKCAVKVMSFEEKQAKRKAEISGLKVALDILNEESNA